MKFIDVCVTSGTVLVQVLVPLLDLVLLGGLRIYLLRLFGLMGIIIPQGPNLLEVYLMAKGQDKYLIDAYPDC